jgi:cysteine desulfurase
MEPALYLQREGWALTIVPVDGHGRVSAADVAVALRPDTALVSIMHANNETGTLQPMQKLPG